MSALELLDWRRRVADLYAEVRAAPKPQAAWSEWRAVRDEMFATHEQSPLAPDARAGFRGLDYFDYDERFRTMAAVESAPPERYDIATSSDEPLSFTRIGVAQLKLLGSEHELELYWLDGYGGGLFLPFTDATSGRSTYGGGRYLFDTVKGADLGSTDDQLVLDFNFAYNPSCSYDPRWACPLAPPPNRLEIAIEAGEKHTQT